MERDAMGTSAVSAEVGAHIRDCRRRAGMTVAQLAALVGKSKATVAKYETGAIVLDVPTLYDIAAALHVGVERLLCAREEPVLPEGPDARRTAPAFFSGVAQFYAYVFDGRANRILPCVFDVLDPQGPGRFGVAMYMNFSDIANYRVCENAYRGTIEHFDALTSISMTNQDTPMEQVRATILASFLDADEKWGLFCGVSSRPLMPIAAKMLFSRHRLPEDAALAERLKISRDDIRMMHLYNMLAVV